MNTVRPVLRLSSAAAVIALFGATQSLHAQTAAAKAKHPTVCAQGVRIYSDPADVPNPHDTLDVPRPDGPIRVTSPEEAEAAELAMRARAGSVGATGIIVHDETTDDGSGNVRMRRSVTGVFVPADSAHAQQACSKKS